MNDEHMEEQLKTLRAVAPPAPSDAARRRALDAAMAAFDTARDNSPASAKGLGWGERLRSIVRTLKGTWIMDTRFSIGLGTAAIALLLLPLGYQLYLSTSLTPPSFGTTQPASPTTRPQPVQAPPAEARDEAAAALDRPAVAQPAPTPPATAKTRESAAGNDAVELAMEAMPAMAAQGERAEGAAAGALTRQVMPSIAPTSMPQFAPAGDSFETFTESPVKITAEEPVSTFSVDVDSTSYAYVRRLLNEGYMPPPEAVRVEEMINYFSYSYAEPDSGEAPFKAAVAVMPTPWNARTELIHVGIKGYAPPATERPAANLVLLIDTSGSMDGRDRLPLVKRAFIMMLDQLGAEDTVSIVTYSGSAGVALEPTRASEKAKILDALEGLSAGGSTAGEQGIRIAYQLAGEHMIEDGINRVILATDGDFNVGISDPDELETFIQTKRDQGISLSVIGVGMGNYTDTTMQALAQRGNGNASYLDSFQEARKVLATELGSTLQTIAQDVKVQVEFNPAVVAEYRLIGYETRALNREDFNNDKVDAGDIGAGHTVTALYEITPVGSGAELVDPLRYGTDSRAGGAGAAGERANDEIGFLKIRYKLPGESSSRLIETPISPDLRAESPTAANEDARWAAAVAAFGQKLRGSNYGGELSYAEISALAQRARGDDAEGYRAEFIQLVDTARLIAGER